jgi:nucleoid DNA-binding protein
MRLNEKKEIVDLFSDVTGMTKESSKIVFDSMAYFVEHCIENHIEFRVSGLFELYFSRMKERTVPDVNDSENMVNLPPVYKAKIRLSKKLRKRQADENKILRPFLENIFMENEMEIGVEIPLTNTE